MRCAHESLDAPALCLCNRGSPCLLRFGCSQSRRTHPSGIARRTVILDQDVWRGGALGELEPQAPYELRRWLESDRGWGDVTVQVVVEVSVDNLKYLLRSPDQSINVID
jgi:hypothetical protein